MTEQNIVGSPHRLTSEEEAVCASRVYDQEYLNKIAILANERGIPANVIARVVLSMKRNASTPHRWRDSSSMKGV